MADDRELTAECLVAALESRWSADELAKIQRYFKPSADGHGEVDVLIGVRMGGVFALAKTYVGMPLDQIEVLLESPIHEVRVGAVSIMDFEARTVRTPDERCQELFDLYLRRHDRINSWDVVDRSAPYVAGRWLSDRPRDVLYDLALSAVLWERRTAIVSTDYFIRQGDLDDTYRIGELLLRDENGLIQKAVGGWIRAAGTKDRPRLLAFLDEHAATMPRTTLRYAIEHLDPGQRSHYRGLRTIRP